MSRLDVGLGENLRDHLQPVRVHDRRHHLETAQYARRVLSHLFFEIVAQLTLPFLVDMPGVSIDKLNAGILLHLRSHDGPLQALLLRHIHPEDRPIEKKKMVSFRNFIFESYDLHVMMQR